MQFDTVRLLGGTTFDLPITNPQPTDNWVCLDIQGLGPTEKDLSVSKTRHQGGVYQNREGQLRELVFKIGINPDWAGGGDVQTLRELLYSLIGGDPDNTDLTVILLKDDDEDFDVRTTGWIKKFEPTLFTKDPDVQLTIGSDQENFFGLLPDDVIVRIPTLSKSNPQFNIKGSAPVGFECRLTLTANLSLWRIYANGGNSFLEFDYAFLSGDIIEFGTKAGNRYAMVTRSGVTKSLLPYLSPGSTWIYLAGAPNGFNDMSVSTSSFNWNMLKYTPEYWGV